MKNDLIIYIAEFMELSQGVLQEEPNQAAERLVGFLKEYGWEIVDKSSPEARAEQSKAFYASIAATFPAIAEIVNNKNNEGAIFQEEPSKEEEAESLLTRRINAAAWLNEKVNIGEVTVRQALLAMSYMAQIEFRQFE